MEDIDDEENVHLGNDVYLGNDVNETLGECDPNHLLYN